MLDAGSCPFAVNEYGDSPLHRLTTSFIRFNLFNGTAMQILLKAGAHLDQADNRGVTSLMILKKLKLQLAQTNFSSPILDSLCKIFHPLQCLSAQVIRQNGIPFDHLPPKLNNFVKKH